MDSFEISAGNSALAFEEFPPLQPCIHRAAGRTADRELAAVNRQGKGGLSSLESGNAPGILQRVTAMRDLICKCHRRHSVPRSLAVLLPIALTVTLREPLTAPFQASRE